MTPKERVKAAMDLQPVDKTPLMCQMSMGHMLLQLNASPTEFWFDKDVYAEGLLAMREQYDFDGILVSLHGHDPEWRKHIVEIEKEEENEIAKLDNGDTVILPYNDLPYYKYSVPKEPPSMFDITENDLPETLDYIPVSQDLYFYIQPGYKFDVLTDLVSKVGEQYSIHGEITSPLDYYFDLIGHQNALMGLLMDPAKAELILKHYTKLVKELAVEMCSTGIDAIKISSPFAGAGFISPDNYRQFVYPYEKEIVEAIRDRGVHVYTHTCGAINDRLEMIFDTGVSGIECLDPAPLGNVELSDAVERIGSRGFIKGNIDSVNSLLDGTEEEIYDDAVKRIDAGRKGKGFILSTACSIAPSVKKESIQLLRKAVENCN